MKKRIFMLGCAAGMLAGLCTAPLMQGMRRGSAASARAEEQSSPYTYEVRGGSVCITGCGQAESGTLEIPEALGGLPVTEIAEGAFRDCTELTSVTVPESVTVIGEQAFFGCTGLEQIDLNCPVKVLPERVFAGCSALKRIDIPESTEEIGVSAFAGCETLRSIVFPESVSLIDDMALGGCASLRDITILNPDCRIVCLAFYYDNLDIRGYSGSTAERYVRLNNNYTFCPLAPRGSVFCDADGDGTVGVEDAQCVLQYYTDALAGKQPSWQALAGNPDVP